MLLESRERFYPVDCYLIDLCLLTQDAATDHWRQVAHSDHVVNYLATAADLQSLSAEHPDVLQQIESNWRDEKQECIGGDWEEIPTALLPLDITIQQWKQGLQTFEEIFKRRPTVWGRRKFGVGSQLPQLLDKLGYDAALHFVMDDGLYPDEEQGLFRWEGCDGTVVDATSRIPLAGDSAASFLRFPLRMSESMDYDHAAVVQFARWPELRTPWLEDFHRIHRYAPVLGRFVTYSSFFGNTESPGRLVKPKSSEYLSPHLLQSVAREESDPISRYADTWVRLHRFEELSWRRGMTSLLEGESFSDGALSKLLGEVAVCESFENDPNASTAFLRQERHSAGQSLSRLIVSGRGDRQGCLIVNPCSFVRRVVVDWPDEVPPAIDSTNSIISRHTSSDRESLVVEVPPSGFVWLPSQVDGQEASRKPRPGKTPLAEVDVLRNEFFEVGISPETGGIASLRTYGRGPNRLSQQIAYRFRHERSIRLGEGEDVEESRTFYSTMRRTESAVVHNGPGIGQIESKGVLFDPQTEELLGEFVQVVTVRRGRPLVEIDLDVTVHKMPEGDPWTNYFGCRWAWNSEDAGLTASVHQGAQPVESGTVRSSALCRDCDRQLENDNPPARDSVSPKDGPANVGHTSHCGGGNTAAIPIRHRC